MKVHRGHTVLLLEDGCGWFISSSSKNFIHFLFWLHFGYLLFCSDIRHLTMITDAELSEHAYGRNEPFLAVFWMLLLIVALQCRPCLSCSPQHLKEGFLWCGGHLYQAYRDSVVYSLAKFNCIQLYAGYALCLFKKKNKNEHLKFLVHFK